MGNLHLYILKADQPFIFHSCSQTWQYRYLPINMNIISNFCLDTLYRLHYGNHTLWCKSNWNCFTCENLYFAHSSHKLGVSSMYLSCRIIYNILRSEHFLLHSQSVHTHPWHIFWPIAYHDVQSFFFNLYLSTYFVVPAYALQLPLATCLFGCRAFSCLFIGH